MLNVGFGPLREKKRQSWILPKCVASCFESACDVVRFQIISFNRPTLVIDRHDLLRREREIGTQKILRVFIPTMPSTDEHTNLTRPLVQLPLTGPDQIGPLPVVCRGQLSALIPLMPERLGPLRALRVIQLPIGLA